MLAYRVGFPALENANAADAAGIAKYIYEDPMEHVGHRDAVNLHAFLVTWKNRPVENYNFGCEYKECNSGGCSHCGLPNNVNHGTLCAFGTLKWPLGGKWFSFEKFKKCGDEVDNDSLPCFTYELLGTVSLDGIAKVKEAVNAEQENAGVIVQQLFGTPVANALAAGAIDQTRLKKQKLFQMSDHMRAAMAALNNGSDSEDSSWEDEDWE